MAESKKDMHDIEACSRIFCSWTWMIGILISIMTAGVALAWTGSKVVAKTEAVIEVHEKRIGIIEVQTSKIDTVIQILRSRDK